MFVRILLLIRVIRIFVVEQSRQDVESSLALLGPVLVDPRMGGRTGTNVSANRHHRQGEHQVLAKRLRQVELVPLVDCEGFLLGLLRLVVVQIAMVGKFEATADVVGLAVLFQQWCLDCLLERRQAAYALKCNVRAHRAFGK